MINERLTRLDEAGVAVWLDDLSRRRLASGELDRFRREFGVAGVTSNPTIFANALAADSEEYAEQVRDLALRGVGVEEAARLLTTFDVRWACDVLRPAFDASSGVDGRVSIEVDPRLARETERTIAEARALWWLVDRENLFIKIPATREGLPAITAALGEGISVNVTLIFDIERYGEVMEAFLAGLELARANGKDLSTIASVASFFVSRVDSEVDRRLRAVGTERALAAIGKAAVANAILAHERHKEVFSSARWLALAAAGARPQRPLWASTSTKNPAYRDVTYVEDLIAPGVVNTMPEATLRAFADHGAAGSDTITSRYADARRVMAELGDLGVAYAEVVSILEHEGVDKFAASWTELLDSVARALGAAKSTAKLTSKEPN